MRFVGNADGRTRKDKCMETFDMGGSGGIDVRLARETVRDDPWVSWQQRDHAKMQ